MTAGASARIDSALCEALVARAAAGDQAAWQALVEHIWPACQGLVRGSKRMGPLRRSDDHVRNVLTNLLEKLGQNDARGLALYADWRRRSPGKTFADWMRIVTTNVIRTYIRDQEGDAMGAVVDDPGVKRLLNEFMRSPALDEHPDRPPLMTLAQTARQLREFARERLPPDQYQALAMWIGGERFEEIAEALSLPEPEAAQKLQRAAVAMLRRHFTGGDAPA